MNYDLMEALKDAAQKKAEMDRETDNLNTAFAHAEQALRQLNLGVVASVPLYDDYRLEWGKENDKWQLMVVRSLTDKAGGEEEITLLRTASRKLRLEAASTLHQLTRALIKAVSEESRRIKDATKQVEKLTELVTAVARTT